MLRICTFMSLSLLLAALSIAPAHADDCSVSSSEREALLALPYAQFDQQPDNGWRPLYERKCYAEAASLLQEYVERHPQAAQEHYMLRFHTGQLAALAGEREEAIRWMAKGYSENASEMINWNAFVDANIAFLQHDREALLKQRELIDLQAPMPDQPGVPEWAVGKKMNLDVVDGFIACFEKPYDVAYGEACRQQGQRPMEETPRQGQQP